MGRGRVDFDRGIARLSTYARIHGHVNPKKGEEWLGWRVDLWIYALRAKYRAGKLSDDQISEAEAIGIKFERPYRDPGPKAPTRAERREARILQRLAQLRAFHAQRGHINIPQHDGIDGWPGAGRWVARLRGHYRRGELSDRVIRVADEMNIRWNLHGKGIGIPSRADQG
ncbi:helicase associated domain-containing protein [Brevibacterium sanguinis]|uniref:helicase associated domain-containing protein n=1 Tax=Brevibacterium sanguinis TaxID=232444 RepID=UPI0031DF47A3